jgi:predicted ArsR family transcriptional regulator
MKDILIQLNPVFDHRNRLGIMSVLAVNEWVDYNSLKVLLQLTDGNLASHLKPLEAAGYIDFKKQFVGRRPQTSYVATDKGKSAFNRHLDALELMVKLGREGDE